MHAVTAYSIVMHTVKTYSTVMHAVTIYATKPGQPVTTTIRYRQHHHFQECPDVPWQSSLSCSHLITVDLCLSLGSAHSRMPRKWGHALCSLGSWLPSLSTVYLKFVHSVARVRNLFLVVAEYYSIVCMDHSLLVRSLGEKQKWSCLKLLNQ